MNSNALHLTAAVAVVGWLGWAQETPSSKQDPARQDPAKQDPAKQDPTMKPRDTQAMPAAVPQQVHLSKLDQVVGLNVKNDAGKDVGEIEDVVIDGADGSIDFFVLAEGGVLGAGEDRHLVPFDRVHLVVVEGGKDGELKGHTSLTEDQVKAAPMIKKGQHPDQDLKARAGELPAGAGATDPMAAHASTGGKACLGKEIDGANVKTATGDELGEIEEVVVDTQNGYVAYLVLGAGGALGLGEKHYALPWGLAQFTHTDDEKLVVQAPLTKERLAQAPEFDSKDWKRMSSTTWLRDVAGYYQVDPYFVRVRPASAERQPSDMGGKKPTDEKKPEETKPEEKRP